MFGLKAIYLTFLLVYVAISVSPGKTEKVEPETQKVVLPTNQSGIDSRATATNDPKCGYNFVDTLWADKIVGGRRSEVGENPWQVSLQYEYSPGRYQHFCGGSLINQRWVVTAAHCVVDFENMAQILRVVLGAHNIKSSRENTIMTKVKRTLYHESYNRDTMANDVALVELERDVNIYGGRSLINTVCLPKAGQKFTGEVITSGWGRLSEGGSSPGILRQVTLALIPDAKCTQYYRGSIYKGMICAGYDQGRKDSCQGDSGGPLIQKSNKQAFLVGIVSWGEGCARPRKPGVYTEVSTFVDWIQRFAKV